MSALLWILALLWPVLFIAVATHELAHTVTARLLGVSVRNVDIGAGQEVAAMTVAGIRVTLRRRPSGGFTDADLSAARSRWHVIATVAAGPAVNAIEAVALLLIGRVAPGTPRDMAAALGAAIGLVAILQVIPNQGNDGALIIRALRGHTVQNGRMITMSATPLMQVVGLNTMRPLLMLLRLGPVLWASFVAMAAYVVHSMVQTLRRG